MTQNSLSSLFLKIGSIAGVYYCREQISNCLIIVGRGAPSLPDKGDLVEAEISAQYNCDYFVPDYIGYARSDGEFTPMNCIKTFIDLYEAFTNGCTGKNTYLGIEKQMRYERIIFLGKSFGGNSISLLPRFQKDIRELILFYPWLNTSTEKCLPYEETPAQFMAAMREDGYHHLYRGILDNQWQHHIENEDDLSPLANIHYLKDTNLFVAHGKKDTCIHYSKSEEFYKRVTDTHKAQSTSHLALYDTGEHGSSTAALAILDALTWMNIQKIQ